MSEKEDTQKRYTWEEVKEHLENWRPPFYYHLMWTWWDVMAFFAELSYYLRKFLRIVENKLLKQNISQMAFIHSDSWNLNSSVAELIIYGVKNIRDRGIGYPCVFSGIEEWHEILLTIQQGFEEYLNIHNVKYEWNSEDEKVAQEKVEKGLELFKKYFLDLWD